MTKECTLVGLEGKPFSEKQHRSRTGKLASTPRHHPTGIWWHQRSERSNFVSPAISCLEEVADFFEAKIGTSLTYNNNKQLSEKLLRKFFLPPGKAQREDSSPRINMAETLSWNRTVTQVTKLCPMITDICIIVYIINKVFKNWSIA